MTKQPTTSAGNDEFRFPGEFPTTNPCRHVSGPGRCSLPARYTYMMGTLMRSGDVPGFGKEGKTPALPFRHILKSDRITKLARVWRAPSAGPFAEILDGTTVVGEPVFIPQKTSSTLSNRESVYGAPRVNIDDRDDDADDLGYVLFQYYTPARHGFSGFVLVDARTMATLAVLEFALHIPYSFHGIWCAEGDTVSRGKVSLRGEDGEHRAKKFLAQSKM